jgi:porphobilinogen synthase
MSMLYRGRRLRANAGLREMVRETRLGPEDLVMPYFVLETEGGKVRRPIAAMPGQCQLSLDALEETVGEDAAASLRSCILFGIPASKDAAGSGAYAENGIVQRAVRRLKKRFPHVQVIADVCLCEYASHGHCGLTTPEGEILNDPSLRLLADAAVSLARAGADIIAPSDMMDGRVAAIRSALDAAGFSMTPIMSYAVKYASAFYGPFRDAAGSAPQFGDRKSYQMDPGNGREALREAAADVDEGADILMVKPAGPCLDIIRKVHDSFPLPVAAYQVSGEYAMIRSAAIHGWIDGDAVMLESLLGIKRAGATLILSYFTSDILHRRLLS